jgi:hypothetical protein
MKRRKQNIRITADGSIIGEDGKFLFFSLKRFRRDIVEGNCCFLCGISPTKTQFNDEHVIPDWILKEFNLHNKLVTLPNSSGFLYSKYKVPCCTSCNSLLGRAFEEPISRLLKGGYQDVLNHVMHDGPWLFYVWLALIFFKTHLKDRSLRFNLDKIKGSEKIAELYDWNTMHHIHCLVRAAYTKAALNRKVMGSFFMLNAKTAKHLEPFDYGDLFFTKTIFLRFNEIVFFCVLDDACATYTLMKDGPISKIAGPLSPVQIREVMARISYATSIVATRPKFFTTIKNGSLKISAKIPKFVKTLEGDQNRYGAIMHRACGEWLSKSEFDNKEFILENVKLGKWTFLFDEKGRFLTDSMGEI